MKWHVRANITEPYLLFRAICAYFARLSQIMYNDMEYKYDTRVRKLVQYFDNFDNLEKTEGSEKIEEEVNLLIGTIYFPIIN